MEAIQSMIAKAYTYLKQNLDSHPLLITLMSMEAAALLAGRDGADGTEELRSNVKFKVRTSNSKFELHSNFKFQLRKLQP